MTDKTKRRLCGTLAAGMLMLGTCASAQASANTYWWGTTSHKLTADERDLAERIVMAEAGGESYECMLGIAQTIRERSEHWGMTVEDVLTARAQYAKPYKGTVSDDAKNAVSAVFDYGERAFDAYTTHFHDDSVNPWWNQSKTKRGEIDGVLFWGAEAEKR